MQIETNLDLWGQWQTRYHCPKIQSLGPVDSHWASEFPPESSSVLMLFLPGSNDQQALRILFTKRSQHVRTHKGQIGFPGGRREADDLSPAVTALREAEEEIGLDRNRVKLLGSLPLVKALDLRPIVPIVGLANIELTDLCRNESEVEELFAIPWTSLTTDEQQRVHFNVFGKWRETSVYTHNTYHVWGLTAKMLQFANLQSLDT